MMKRAGNKRSRAITCIVTSTCAWFAYGCLQPSATRALDVGVGTHFAQGKTDAAAFASWSSAMHIGSMRDELYWDHVERAPGVFRLEGDALRTVEAIRAAHARGMRPLLTLDYGNPLYGGGLPHDARARAGFAAYSAFVAKTLAGSVRDFEVWNEWNIGFGSQPKQKQGSPEDYVALLAATSAAVKRVAPRARVIAGAITDDLDWSWTRRAIEAGMLKHADAISIHLYNYMMGDARGAPEFLRRIESLHALLERVAPQRDVPILITEMGWPNHVGAGHVDPLEAGAELLTMLLALNELPYIGGVWLYEFRDGGDDAHDVEQNFGLVTHDYTQKPISQALVYALSKLQNSVTERRLETRGFRGSVLRLGDGRRLLAIWRSADNMCRSAPVAVSGPLREAVPERLGFVRASACSYAEEGQTWTIPADALPQLFWLDTSVPLGQLALSARCPEPTNVRCAVDSARCRF